MYKGVIYSIQNKFNNKQYIGQTVNFKKRICQHFSNSKSVNNTSPLYRSIRKYGKKNFTVSIIQEIKCLEEKDFWNRINKAEMYYIEKYNTISKNGYNLTAGGEGLKGYKYTDEHRKKISKHTKKMWEKGIFDNRPKSWNKGIKMEDHKKNMNQDKKILFKGENNPFYGKSHSKETLDKISKNRKGKLVGKDNPSARSVINIDTGKTFDTMKEAAEFYNIQYQNNIIGACKNPVRTCSGYHWAYVQ